MAESLFEIFGNTEDTLRNENRQPLFNNENMGIAKLKSNMLKSTSMGPLKPTSMGPTKPIEPMKKGGDIKKTFLCNKGLQPLQATPVAKKALSPRSKNICAAIYNDVDKDEINFDEIQFTKPNYTYDNFHEDLFDYLKLDEPVFVKESSPKLHSPPSQKISMEMHSSFDSDFYTDESSIEAPYYDDDLGLPDLY